VVSNLLCVPLQAVSRRTVIYIIFYCIYRLLCYIILHCLRYIRPPAGLQQEDTYSRWNRILLQLLVSIIICRLYVVFRWLYTRAIRIITWNILYTHPPRLHHIEPRGNNWRETRICALNWKLYDDVLQSLSGKCPRPQPRYIINDPWQVIFPPAKCIINEYNHRADGHFYIILVTRTVFVHLNSTTSGGIATPPA